MAQTEYTTLIPNDIMIEILRRLPARDILRFRCVCKLWQSLTQECHFINKHSETSSQCHEFGVVSLSCDPLTHELVVFYIANVVHRFDLSDLYVDECYRMSNSCNGLVCVYGKHTTYVVNPSIREVIVLAEVRPESLTNIALGYDNSTGEYKVVRLFGGKDNKKTGCEIYNLGSYSWRIIQGPPLPILYPSYPVVVNGAIHWLVGSRDYDIPEVAIAFDIKNETFSIIRHPTTLALYGYTGLAEWEGKLCLAATPCFDKLSLFLSRDFGNEQACRRYKDIWILEDYDCRVWKKLCINMESIEVSHVAVVALPTVVRGEKVLWQSNLKRGGYPTRHMKDYPSNLRFDFYDLKRESFMRPSLALTCGYELAEAHSYYESIVSPIAIEEKNMGSGYHLPSLPI